MIIAIIISIAGFAILGAGMGWSCYNTYVDLKNKVSAAKDMVMSTYLNYLRARDSVPKLEKQFSDIDVAGNQGIIKEAGTASMSGIFFGSTERYPHYQTQKSGVQMFSQYIQPFTEAKEKYIEAARVLNTYMNSFPQSLFKEKFGFYEEYPESTIELETYSLERKFSRRRSEG